MRFVGRDAGAPRKKVLVLQEQTYSSSSLSPL
jgi:hypothetical protein